MKPQLRYWMGFLILYPLHMAAKVYAAQNGDLRVAWLANILLVLTALSLFLLLWHLRKTRDWRGEE